MLYRDILGVDSRTTLDFFRSNIQEVVETSALADDEVLYVASILANYAQTSRYDTESLPILADLSEVFDMFVFQERQLLDPEILEIAGAQTMLFAGFFRRQMRRRHDVKWYDSIGSSFYHGAALHSRNRGRSALFGRISDNFRTWTRVCQDLSRTLEEKRLAIQ